MKIFYELVQQSHNWFQDSLQWSSKVLVMKVKTSWACYRSFENGMYLSIITSKNGHSKISCIRKIQKIHAYKYVWVHFKNRLRSLKKNIHSRIFWECFGRGNWLIFYKIRKLFFITKHSTKAISPEVILNFLLTQVKMKPRMFIMVVFYKNF